MRITPVLALLLSVPTAASAHITVAPKQSVAGAAEKYEFRVPNEKEVDTVEVEVQFPAGLRVRAVEQKPGWHTEVLRNPSDEVRGARWTGKLPSQQFVEFGVLASNPSGAGQLTFVATQIFSDGTKVEWSGTSGSRTPAPQVTLTGGDQPTEAAHH